ncbi:MAG: hypothetical protein Q8Q32_01350 [bacterium]|nr:hypothetical protein [bacterium]
MLKVIYKRILRKLRLSSFELKELQFRLTEENISVGPFVDGKKMCPNTTALSIKERINLNNNNVRKTFKAKGVSGLDLMLFYLLFDLPAKISRKRKVALIKKLKESINEL